jgi:hypothetical protein
LTTFYNNNKTACLVGGALAIGLLIVGSRRKPDGY